MGKLTRTQRHGLGVVVGVVVLDPLPVDVGVVAPGVGVGEEHLGDGAVAEEARGQGHLQAEPVARVADVEDVAGVGGAG